VPAITEILRHEAEWKEDDLYRGVVKALYENEASISATSQSCSRAFALRATG
jgi:hypothetical protein